MEKLFNTAHTQCILSCTQDYIIHKIGSDEYPIIRKSVVAAETADSYEEVAVSDIPPYTENQYKAAVESLIRERYSASDEIALINNIMEENPSEEHQSEYAAYQSYREECKIKAKATLTQSGE